MIIHLIYSHIIAVSYEKFKIYFLYFILLNILQYQSHKNFYLYLNNKRCFS